MLGLGWRCQPHADVPGPQGADAGSQLLPALCPAAAPARRGQAGMGSAQSSAEVHFLSACWCRRQRFCGTHRAQSCPRAAQLSPAHRYGGTAARQEGGASSSVCPGSWGNMGSSAVPPCIYLLSEWIRRNEDCPALHAGPPGPFLCSAMSPGDSKCCAEATGKEVSVPLPSWDQGSQTGLGALGITAPPNWAMLDSHCCFLSVSAVLSSPLPHHWGWHSPCPTDPQLWGSCSVPGAVQVCFPGQGMSSCPGVAAALPGRCLEELHGSWSLLDTEERACLSLL